MKQKRRNTKQPHRNSEKLRQGNGNLEVKVDPWGLDEEAIATISRTVLQHESVLNILKQTRHRLLSIQLIEPELKNKPVRIPIPPNRYRATIYDYTNNRTVWVDGHVDDLARIEVSESGYQPLPSPEEFEAAVNTLLEDREIGPFIQEGQLQAHLALPPLIPQELPTGRTERSIAIALLNGNRTQEIVGVNLVRNSVIRFERGAPDGAGTPGETCGTPGVDPNTARTSGQVRVTVTQGGTVLWRFIAVRPAASSGTNGSGIELRFVDYRGKRVLYRAHVPVLNVKYDNDACGPYRDWQNEEAFFQANGTDIGATGFRLCPTPAQTILDTGSDMGNFRGVAIYLQGQEVVLVSEMQAGWYRYISEWRLHTDGTIRPRFGFTAVNYHCVCRRHYHHVYWRFDFDIRTAGDNVVREFNDPPIISASNWHVKSYEIRRPRDLAHNRKWRVENASTGEAYDLLPGLTDGVATASPDWPFPRGDVWILKYRATEIDDGVVAIGPPYEASILDTWQANWEPIQNQDVVIWYAAHFTHDIAHHAGHIVGPELRPVTW
jgi:hypothetical protein